LRGRRRVHRRGRARRARRDAAGRHVRRFVAARSRRRRALADPPRLVVRHRPDAARARVPGAARGRPRARPREARRRRPRRTARQRARAPRHAGLDRGPAVPLPRAARDPAHGRLPRRRTARLRGLLERRRGAEAVSGPRRAAFRAFECRPGGALEEADWALEPNGDGWTVLREGRPHVALGAGYRLLRTAVCGVCSTDLDRHFLPFPLPQVIGHEVVVLDGDGRRHVVEINASPGARGLAAECPDCRAGLGRHCPKRLVLGIHDLPGGFGAYVLAPAHAVLPVPDAVPTETAALVEPFAAALRATEVLALDRHASVAVLGPRRLGMLVIAALAAERRRRGLGFGLTAIVRRRELAPLARELGADTVVVSADAAETLGEGAFDAVVDTTGTPEGFDAALRLARCEVHLKSTNGRPAGG